MKTAITLDLDHYSLIFDFDTTHPHIFLQRLCFSKLQVHVVTIGHYILRNAPK